MQYVIRRAAEKPPLTGEFDHPTWRHADIANIDKFHPRSSEHRPQTQVKMLYDDSGIYAIFRVHDRYVRCVRTENQTDTCKDSCVEAFLQPKPGMGYLNFELNCGGAIMAYYITDPDRRKAPPLGGWHRLDDAQLATIRIYHSMPKTTPVEISDALSWSIQYFVPNQIFETYVGPLGDPSQRQWRGNFYKCADETSHPHWASWNGIGEKLNFHQPEFFAPIRFE
jgi:hypothetical protein